MDFYAALVRDKPPGLGGVVCFVVLILTCSNTSNTHPSWPLLGRSKDSLDRCPHWFSPSSILCTVKWDNLHMAHMGSVRTILRIRVLETSYRFQILDLIALGTLFQSYVTLTEKKFRLMSKRPCLTITFRGSAAVRVTLAAWAAMVNHSAASTSSFWVTIL